MEAYYVYMLRCRGGSLYTGMTNDVARRMAMHCSGRGAKYTRAHPPEALAALWRCGDKITASRLEYAVNELAEALGVLVQHLSALGEGEALRAVAAVVGNVAGRRFPDPAADG